MNEKISTQVSEWAQDHLGKDFKFRTNQKEIIVQIIDDKINNNISHHIVQAPTGSGKSLINIISAGVLWKYYNMKSYILCSDLYLYKQYEDFIDKYNLEDFKYLKGQTGNYWCSKNNSDLRNAPCKMAGVSYKNLLCLMNMQRPEDAPSPKLKKLYNIFPCAHTCPYLIERFEAVSAPITLMTYHLFYFQMNICKLKIDSHGMPIVGQFQYRDFIFCDECHNIPSIMQNRCRPTIKYDDLIKMTQIFNYYKSIKKNITKLKIFDYMPSEQEIQKRFKLYWNQMLDKKLESYDNTIVLLNYTRKLVDIINMFGERIQRIFGTKVTKGLSLTDKEKEIYSKICWLQNYHCYLNDFARAIEISGFHYTYKQINPGNIINFGTVKEDGIIFLFLLRYGIRGTTMVSATIGNEKSFIENCGYIHFKNHSDLCLDIKDGQVFSNHNTKYINIPSDFNFEYSPIYIDTQYKMNFLNKKINIIYITEKINNILNYHNEENGMIQCGSYENAQNIYKLIDQSQKHRILIYKNSIEKKDLIKKINKNTNYVIIGPSLNEGIDLPGELCTFIIIAKVPYMSLGDKYVTSKMKIFKKWYNETAANNIIQGIGRGNRFVDDWCSIYILDGCFKRLYSYTKNSFPKFITNRFEYINIDKLIENNKTNIA